MPSAIWNGQAKAFTSQTKVLQTEHDGFDKIPLEETGTSSASAENINRSVQIHHIEPAENHSSLASVHSSPEPGASGSGQNFQGGQLSNDTSAQEEHENLGLLVLDRTFKEVNSPTIRIKDGIFFSYSYVCILTSGNHRAQFLNSDPAFCLMPLHYHFI
jgi:hypothetical protein